MAARGMDDIGGPQAWYDSIPLITKQWFTAALAITCMGNMDIIPIKSVIWDFQSVKDSFEIWRFLTPFCYIGPFSFPTAITLYLLYQYSRQYEQGGPINTGGGGGTADYLFMLIFGAVFILVSSSFIPVIPLFSKNLVFYTLYVWSKQNPNAPANIYGVPMKAMHLPFAMLGLNILMGNPWVDIAHGIGVGHLYYFLVEVVPVVYGKDYIHTPQFLIETFGVGQYVAPAPRPAAVGGGRRMDAVGNNTWNAPGRVNRPNDPAAPAGGGGGHNWGGGGRALGRE